MSAKIDPFTRRRLLRYIEEFRTRSGILPTLQDFEANGFERALIDAAEREGCIEKYYVTLTSGTIVKGYKIKTPG